MAPTWCLYKGTQVWVTKIWSRNFLVWQSRNKHCCRHCVHQWHLFLWTRQDTPKQNQDEIYGEMGVQRPRGFVWIPLDMHSMPWLWNPYQSNQLPNKNTTTLLNRKCITNSHSIAIWILPTKAWRICWLPITEAFPDNYRFTPIPHI